MAQTPAAGRVTLAELAAEAEVSLSTISKVLNGRSDVSRKTRTKVEALLDGHGYQRRDGQPTLPSTKGSTFKGPFHLPRMLIVVDQMLGEMLEK